MKDLKIKALKTKALKTPIKNIIRNLGEDILEICKKQKGFELGSHCPMNINGFLLTIYTSGDSSYFAIITSEIIKSFRTEISFYSDGDFNFEVKNCNYFNRSVESILKEILRKIS